MQRKIGYNTGWWLSFDLPVSLKIDLLYLHLALVSRDVLTEFHIVFTMQNKTTHLDMLVGWLAYRIWDVYDDILKYIWTI